MRFKVDRKGMEAAAATEMGFATAGGRVSPTHSRLLDGTYLLVIQTPRPVPYADVSWQDDWLLKIGLRGA